MMKRTCKKRAKYGGEKWAPLGSTSVDVSIGERGECSHVDRVTRHSRHREEILATKNATKAVFDSTESGFGFVVNPDSDSLANRTAWDRGRGPL